MGGPSGAGEGGGCVDGTPTCPCYGNMTCNDGLVSEDDVCVPAMPVVCGDGILGGTEECDAGADNGDTKLCKANCTLQKCGDGFVGPGEACDDGNAVDNDACSNACVPAACGDMVVQMGEACDDGNGEATDACIACKAAACGDTFVQGGVEECDDGNVEYVVRISPCCSNLIFYFHDGTPFTADDVLFTFARASGEGSVMKSYTNDIKEVRKQGDHVIEALLVAPTAGDQRQHVG